MMNMMKLMLKELVVLLVVLWVIFQAFDGKSTKLMMSLLMNSFMDEKKKTGSDIDTRPIPRFGGKDTDDRLRKACDWVALHCPGRQLTLEELGQIMGVTRERVRQIKGKIFDKLQHVQPLRALHAEMEL